MTIGKIWRKLVWDNTVHLLEHPWGWTKQKWKTWKDVNVWAWNAKPRTASSLGWALGLTSAKVWWAMQIKLCGVLIWTAIIRFIAAILLAWSRVWFDSKSLYISCPFELLLRGDGSWEKNKQECPINLLLFIKGEVDRLYNNCSSVWLLCFFVSAQDFSCS